MQIIISMAGLGKRFKDRGFKTSKHLIKVNNKTLIENAIDSLNINGKYYFIIRKSNDDNEIKNILSKYKNSSIIEIDYVTEGPASSAYLCKDLLNINEELIVTNCDQILEWNSQNFLNKTRKDDLDCSVLTYKSTNLNNSFILLHNNIPIKIIEKEQISDCALVGVHYFKKAAYFIESYEYIYNNKIKNNNEYYMSTVCNNMIGKYKVNHILLEDNEMYYSTGTPEYYFDYLNKNNKLNIEKYNIKDMFRGWFIGNFEPSVYKTNNFEVGYLLHKKGEMWDVHYHEYTTEINLLIEGKMILNNIEINKNEIFIINKNNIAAPIFLEDCYIICIKVPSIIGDKIII